MWGCLKVVCIATGLVLIAGAVATISLFMQADAYSRAALERAIRFALGVEITVGRLELRPLQQRVDAYDVVIGNPPPFKPGPAIEIQRLSIAFNAATLFSKSPVIRRLALEGVRFNLHHEVGHGTNLSVLAKQAAGPGKSAEVRGRSFVLQELRCEDARMRMSSNLLPIGSAGIALAPFTLCDLGDRPVSIGDITSIFVRSVLREALTLKGLLNPAVRLLQDESDTLETP